MDLMCVYTLVDVCRAVIVGEQVTYGQVSRL